MPENSSQNFSNHIPSKRRSQAKRNSSDKHLRIENLTLENFKVFDNLTIVFPIPHMANDPDIVVMGSKNGLGKTSILEACSLLFLAASGENLEYISHQRTNNLLDILIRAGHKTARIRGIFTVDNETVEISLILSRSGKIETEGNAAAFRPIIQRTKSTRPDISNSALRFSLSLAGLSSEPLLTPPFIYFHSYRKVQEGRLELGAMVDEERSLIRSRYPAERETSISTFKQIVLRSLMSRGSLFEDFDSKEAEDILNILNNLMEEYAGGRIEKLRPSVDSKIEFRVTSVNDPSMSFNFDGLSSGQKEIISTLFLIWNYTRTQSGIILIDEPELHLNPEWHRGFIHHLYRLAPRNQYIIATHSEDIFSAVDKDRRILLAPDVERIR